MTNPDPLRDLWQSLALTTALIAFTIAALAVL